MKRVHNNFCPSAQTCYDAHCFCPHILRAQFRRSSNERAYKRTQQASVHWRCRHARCRIDRSSDDRIRDEKQAEADAVRNQLVGLQADLEAAADSYKQALDAQEVAQAAMEAEQVKIDEANGKIADLQDKLGTRARSMYRSGSSSFLDFVMGATSFEEFTQNWDLLNKMNENASTMPMPM